MKQLNRFYFDQAISIDNALTTNQIIHQLINNLNGVIEFVNNIETDAHEYTDAEISKLKIELEGEIGELNDLLDLRVSELTNLIDTKKAEAVSDAKGYTDVSIENLKTDYITPIIDRIDGTLNRLDLKIDYVDASIRNLVDETKAELIDLISKGGAIYSGVTGERTNPEVVTKQLVDKVQHKNGVDWNDIASLMMSQATGTDTELTDESVSNLKIKLPVAEICNKVSTYSYYFSNYMFMYGNDTSSSRFYHLTRYFAITLPLQCTISFIKINGLTVYKDMYDINPTTFRGVIPIPFLIRETVNDEWQAGFSSFDGYTNSITPLKRINHIEIHTSMGIIDFNFEIPFLSFELPTYDTIIASCASNKKWNTWDTLTYYTTKFLSEHLATEHYNIPISNENEILYNNAPTLKNFYDNRT